MRQKTIVLFLVLMSSLLLAIDSFAETIYLKNGKTIEGQITKRNDTFIRVGGFKEFAGSIVFFNKEIDKIDNKKTDNFVEITSLLSKEELLNRSFYVLLLSSEQIGKNYKSAQPFFSLVIPNNTSRAWSFFRLNAPGGKFYIVDEKIFLEPTKGHPRIDCLPQPIPPEFINKTPEEIFQEISASYKNHADVGVNIINNGSPVADISNFKAFERIEEIISQERKWHTVVIFIDKYFLVFLLNSKIADFDQDDKDFINIVKTLAVK